MGFRLVSTEHDGRAVLFAVAELLVSESAVVEQHSVIERIRWPLRGPPFTDSV